MTSFKNPFCKGISWAGYNESMTKNKYHDSMTTFNWYDISCTDGVIVGYFKKQYNLVMLAGTLVCCFRYFF